MWLLSPVICITGRCPEAQLLSPHLIPVLPSIAQEGTELSPPHPALHFKDHLSSPFPTWGQLPPSCQVTITQCHPRLCFVSQSGIPGAARGFDFPWGCARLGGAAAPCAQGWEYQGLKHPPQSTLPALWVPMAGSGTSVIRARTYFVPTAPGFGVREPLCTIPSLWLGKCQFNCLPGGTWSDGEEDKSHSSFGSTCNRSPPCRLLHHSPSVPGGASG